MKTSTTGQKKPTISARLANGERKEAMQEIDDDVKKFAQKVREDFDKLCNSGKER